MQAKNYLVLDTETTGIYKDSLAFDVGYVITTRRETVLERRFLVREVIASGEAMMGAFYSREWRNAFGRKMFDLYIPEIAAGLPLTDWAEIVEIMRDDMATHGVDVFSAYNLAFDMRIIRQTNAALADGKVLAYRPTLLDLWLFACVTVCNRPTYHTLADARGWRSEAGNVRTNAEKTFAYLTGDFDFIEEHTALADAQIEAEILRRMLAAKKPIPYDRLDGSPWRLAQK